MDEREVRTRRRRGRKTSWWGADHEEVGANLGWVIGVVVIFGYPVLLLIVKFAALLGIHM